MAFCDTTNGIPPKIASIDLMDLLRDALRHDIPLMSLQELLSSARIMVDALSALNIRINSLMPANRLPSELLVRIFQYAAVRVHVPDPKRDNFVRQHQHVSFVDLLNITHVCQAWRDAALSSPLLWTCLSDRNHPRLDAFRARSGSAPLFYELTKADDAYTLGLLREDGLRVRRLDINVSKADGRYFEPNSLEFDGTALECLTMRARCLDTNVEPYPTPAQPATGLFTVYRQRTVPLRALAIYSSSSMWLPPSNMQLPDLTHLYLSLAFRSRRAETITELLQLLANTPRAQYVYILGIAPADAASFSQPDDALKLVSLPHLKRFACGGGDVNTAAGLLSHLRFPKNVSVYLRHVHHTRDLDLPQYWQPLPEEYAQSLHRLTFIFDKHSVRLWMDGTLSRSALTFDVRNDRQNIAEESGKWLRRLRALVPLTSIHTLVTEVDSEDAVRSIGNLLRLLPSLVNLRVRVDATPPLFNTLIDRIRLLLAPVAAGGPEICCPLLQVFYVNLPQDPEGVEGFYPEGIIAILRGRADKGVPIRHLAVRARNKKAREDVDGGPAAWLERVEAAFSSAEGLVETLDLALYDRTLRAFGTDGANWRITEEEERYWSLQETSMIRPV